MASGAFLAKVGLGNGAPWPLPVLTRAQTPVVDGRRQEADFSLPGAKRLGLFPPIGGG